MLQQTTLLDVAEAVGRIRRETLRGLHSLGAPLALILVLRLLEARCNYSTTVFGSNAIRFMDMDRYKSAFAAAVCGGASLERG
jgi:hypothetical protein